MADGSIAQTPGKNRVGIPLNGWANWVILPYNNRMKNFHILPLRSQSLAFVRFPATSITPESWNTSAARIWQSTPLCQMKRTGARHSSIGVSKKWGFHPQIQQSSARGAIGVSSLEPYIEVV